MAENQITANEVDEIILELLKLHSQKVFVDEKYFLDLLRHSLSLNTMEKKRVVDAVPTLSQFQFYELIKVFKEEREKFKELAWAHPDDIKNLLAKQQAEWLILWDVYRIEKESKAKQTEDNAQIENIKASLWL